MGEPVVQTVAADLEPAGVHVQPYDAAAHMPSVGIVAFADVTAPVCEFVRDASRNGSRRILALSASPAPVTGGRSWDLLHAGASDVLTWEGRPNPALHVAARLRRWRAVDELVASRPVRDVLVGESAVWQTVLREAVEVARFTDASVLITGESGTGKELVARLIHELDARPAKRNLVVLDCTTVVPSLSGSEFFGHERGAFTGAVAAREGAFELADGGTLFLDEVGELPATLQAELLRVVQEGTYKRVGSNSWRKSNFRLVCATNRNLLDEQAQGTFRSDFYYRIAGWTLHLPSLRDRLDDVVPLFHHFYRQLHAAHDSLSLDDAVRELLLTRAYPGNVRDLRSLVFRVCHRHVGEGPVTVGDIPEEERPAPGEQDCRWSDEAFERCIRRSIALGATLREIGAGASDTAIRVAIADEGGNLQRAARRLGVTDRALQLRQAARRGRPAWNERDGGDEESVTGARREL